MPKTTGLGDRLLVDGVDLSGAVGALGRIGGGPAALEMTGIDKSAFERFGGIRDGGIEWTGFFDDAAPHTALRSLPTADRFVTYLRGTVLGGPGAACLGKQLNYDFDRGTDGALGVGVTVESDGAGIEWGLQLTAGLRTDTTATNGASLDGAAPTTFGGQAYLQVTAVTGTSVTVALQDSADNTSFAAISGAAFAAATGPGGQRITFSGTVRRYVRAVTTGTFTSATFNVLFVRNETAVTF